MEKTSSKIDESFLREYVSNKERKIRKIRNIKALLEKKKVMAMHCAEELLENIKLEIFRDLNEVSKRKCKSLEEMENKIENIYLFLIEAYKNFPNAEHNISQIMETVLHGTQLLSYLNLDFIKEDLFKAKYSIGYIKSSSSTPEDLSVVVNKEKFEIGNELVVWVKGDKPWYPLMIHSLAGFAQSINGKKILPNIVDGNDGSYVFLFRLYDYSKYFINITLYGRPIKNSPTIVEFKCNEPKIQNSRNINHEVMKASFIKASSPRSTETPFIENKNLNEEYTENVNVVKCISEKNRYQAKKVPLSTTMDYNEKPSLSANLENKISSNHDDYWSDECTDSINNIPVKEHETMLENDNNKNENQDECWLEDCVDATNDNIPERNDESNLENDEKIGSVKAHLVTIISQQCGIDLHFPIGVAVNHHNDVIICDTGHHTVWIVNEHGKPKAVFDQRKEGINFFRPSAVVVTGDGGFVIKDSNGLHLYDHHGIFVRSIGEYILNRPFGLAVTEDDKLITLDETWKPKLFVFNKDGQTEDENLFEPLFQRAEKSKCRFMASFSNEVVVSDLGLSKIYKTAINGKFIKNFGYYGRTAGAMIEPSGIALDPNGTMLIADSKNDRVQIFDWDGDYLGEVEFSHPIRRPSDITLTKDGHLYVLNYLDHYLSIYRLKIED